MILVVDVANVMGSRPDGWWRDRPAAATRLLASLAPLLGAEVVVPQAVSASAERIDRIVGVLEGKSRTATAGPELEVVLAPADGDSTIVAIAEQLVAGAEVPLVVTADRGLRERLPPAARVAGPGWLLALL